MEGENDEGVHCTADVSYISVIELVSTTGIRSEKGKQLLFVWSNITTLPGIMERREGNFWVLYY